MKLPTIICDRIKIRPLDVKDAKDMFEYATSNLVGPRAGWAPHESLQDTIHILKNMTIYKPSYELGNWAIVDLEKNKMIGTIELYNYAPEFKAELGYALNPEYWNKGIVTEAAKAVLDYGFNHLKLKRIEAATFIDNYASQKVCEKIGMTKEGILRNGYLRYDGVIFDKVIYGITAHEYEMINKESVNNDED